VVLWDWINSLLEKLAIAPVRRQISLQGASRLGVLLEGLHKFFPCLGEPRMTRFIAHQLAQSHWFSHERARQDFGYQPMVDPDIGLQRLLAWMKH